MIGLVIFQILLLLGFFVKHMVLAYIQDFLSEGLDGFVIFIT
jgi:hypothetical protein